MKKNIKKLVVNKKTISNLNVVDMMQLGGDRTNGNGKTCTQCNTVTCLICTYFQCTRSACAGAGCQQ